MQTPREIVRRCLKFQHPERTPRDLWVLPWAATHYPDAVSELRARYPSDIGVADDVYHTSPVASGNRYAVGTAVDEWGCVFTNIQAGVIGEVRDPIIKNLDDYKSVKPPYVTLPENSAAARDAVNRCCGKSDRFMRGNACARPWERYQFLRGSENALLDLMELDDRSTGLLRAIHEYYLREMEFWTGTDVDFVYFMDDWGSQHSLLINPALWRELFKPLYRDYCALAHAKNKFIFMHSDGNIQAIYPDLIEIGVDAVNSQLFCMDFDFLERHAKGRITFWGEIDRQHVLPSARTQDGRDAVRRVARHLHDPAGGLIAQFEFGAGANPQTALAVAAEWIEYDRERQTAAVSS
jgi:uroporphyrinogen decarboxylase